MSAEFRVTVTRRLRRKRFGCRNATGETIVELVATSEELPMNRDIPHGTKRVIDGRLRFYSAPIRFAQSSRLRLSLMLLMPALRATERK